jgi:hypothetical protein
VILNFLRKVGHRQNVRLEKDDHLWDVGTEKVSLYTITYICIENDQIFR